MTSHFDDLMGIYHRNKNNPKFRTMINWLADICIEQTNTKKKGWNFEWWLKQRWGGKLKQGLGMNEVEIKYEYLNDCHDALDHAQWHLKVFDLLTVHLISLVLKIVGGEKKIYPSYVEGIDKRFPKILDFLKDFNYIESDFGWEQGGGKEGVSSDGK